MAHVTYVCHCVCMHLVYVCVVCGYMYMHTCIHISVCLQCMSVYGCVLGVILLFLQGLVVRCFLTDQCGLLCGYMKVSFPLTHPPTFNFVVF